LNRPDLPEEELLERGAFARHPEWSDLAAPHDSFVGNAFASHSFATPTIVRLFYRSKIGKRTDEEIKTHFRRWGFERG
jgi:hypothetical protein